MTADEAERDPVIKGFNFKTAALISFAHEMKDYSYSARKTRCIPQNDVVQNFYLMSEELPDAQNVQCLHYSYKLTGNASLTVAYTPSRSDINKVLNTDVEAINIAWTTSSNVILKWIHPISDYPQEMSVDLPIRIKSKIVFQSRFSHSKNGSVILDEIHIIDGPCKRGDLIMAPSGSWWNIGPRQQFSIALETYFKSIFAICEAPYSESF
ncbi:uncharacterized protein LOC134232377 [Saccostrea cucullata]|uniref:uncharacterized protein LOC134232377 n=1 Tax=Saccostrea cuccullata TaxID=36930 RepID=UPI002ECFE362